MNWKLVLQVEYEGRLNIEGSAGCGVLYLVLVDNDRETGLELYLWRNDVGVFVFRKELRC